MALDGGRLIDWSRTSADYALHRPGPPPSFFSALMRRGIGLPDQAILDLGTGTGVLARQFALQGSLVSGIDIAAGQIEQAQRLSIEQGVEIDFRVGPVEELPFPDASFDAVTANQCFHYFDHARLLPELRRVLRPGGLVSTSHFSWLPLEDEIARASEEVVLKFNPDWTAHSWKGIIPGKPKWAEPDWVVESMFWYDEAIPFSHEAWVGRMRASRGVGATLPPDEVAAFSEKLAALLAERVPDPFTVLHRIDGHVLRFA